MLTLKEEDWKALIVLALFIVFTLIGLVIVFRLAIRGLMTRSMLAPFREGDVVRVITPSSNYIGWGGKLLEPPNEAGWVWLVLSKRPDGMVVPFGAPQRYHSRDLELWR